MADAGESEDGMVDVGCGGPFSTMLCGTEDNASGADGGLFVGGFLSLFGGGGGGSDPTTAAAISLTLASRRAAPGRGSYSVPLSNDRLVKRALHATDCASLAFLDPSSLAKLAAVDSELRVWGRADRLWAALLVRYKSHSQSYGRCNGRSYGHCYGRDEIMCVVGRRTHGDARDIYSYFPADGDSRASGLVLVGDKFASAYSGSLQDLKLFSRISLGRHFDSRRESVRFNPETGTLEDKFHPAHESIEVTREQDPSGTRGLFSDSRGRTDIWIERDFPVHCAACAVECTSAAEYRDHCCSWSHHEASLPPEKRLPEAWTDPRDLKTFAGIDGQTFAGINGPFLNFTVALWSRNVHAYLRTSAAAEQEAIQRYVQTAMEWVEEKESEGWLEEHELDPDELLANCTLEGATAVCVDYVACDFEQRGLKDGHARDVIIGGWRSTELIDDVTELIACSETDTIGGITGFHDWN